MGTELSKLLNILNNIKVNEKSIKDFFEKYDVIIILIVSIKLKNIKLWLKSWLLIYYRNKYDEYYEFFTYLENKWIKKKTDFIEYNKNLYNLIIYRKINLYHIWKYNDIYFIFSSLNINILLDECKKIKIHSNKETKEFTQETCIESLYFYRANTTNNYCNKIKYNVMMRDLCKDLSKYLAKKWN